MLKVGTMRRGSDSVDCTPMSRRTDNASALQARAFAAPRRLAVRRIIAAAAGKLTVSTQPTQPVHVRYLDTFDRRLRHAGYVLEHTESLGDTRLRYREIGRVQALVEAPETPLPAFASEIAHSRLRSLLSPLIDIRRLLVVAEARGRLTVARGRDHEDKTVLVMECFAGDSGPARLTVRPLRGYERFARRAIRQLREVEGIVPDDSEPMLAARDGPGAVFGGMAVGARPDLAPDERSDSACKRLLASLDAVLETNAPGIEADLDPECLHDFRVATRKARSLLREMKGVFARTVTRRLRADFGWLGQCTGPVRDLDVQLMDLGAVGGDGEAPADTVAAALHDHLEKSRKREFRALCRILQSARYRRARSALRTFLEGEVPQRPQSANAMVPIASLSAARIHKVYRRTLAEGRAIGDDSPAESLHDLRKTCKRLRYLLEFFRGIHSGKPVVRTIARLKRLQDNLGAYQDVQVQRAVLEAFRERAGASLDAAGVDAVEVQCAALVERERKTRAEFSARFASYDSKRAHRQFVKSLRRKRR